jgi:hypothetical protein
MGAFLVICIILILKIGKQNLFVHMITTGIEVTCGKLKHQHSQPTLILLHIH